MVGNQPVWFCVLRLEGRTPTLMDQHPSLRRTLCG
jgi:hypothetical protein